MKPVRIICARLVAICLAVAIVAGTLGMAPGPAIAADAPHQDAVAAIPDTGHAAGCPSERNDEVSGKMTHGACAMTMCCFSELPDWRTDRLATVEPARFDPLVQRIVPRSEPEKADKPPRQS